MTLKEKIQRARKLLEIPGDLWWIRPDGELVDVPSDSTHMSFVALHPEELNLDKEFAKDAYLSELLNSGFIRLRRAGSLNVAMSTDTTRDAFSKLKEFVNNRMNPGDIVNIEIGTIEADLTAELVGKQRNVRALANTVENPPSRARGGRGVPSREPRDFR